MGSLKNNKKDGFLKESYEIEAVDSYTERLESVDKVMTVSEIGLKITEDSLLLANFIKNKLEKKSGKSNRTFFHNRNMLEIGAGQGIISLLVSGLPNISKIYAVEVQKEVFGYLVGNVEKNSLQSKILVLNEDIRNVVGEYDYIFSNPPYKKVNSGKLPQDKTEAISKYEVLLTLEELFFNTKRLLKNYGEFFVIVPEERLNDSFRYIYKNELQILSLNINQYKKKKLIIIHGKKGGKINSGIEIEYNLK
ncbi:MAG: methyltransferase [Pseudoleptotrichia goodfellowii]|jgi:methyltransferase small|nr:methyltransferase [Pseudoleptotrichia goodfellowii]